MQVVSWVLSPDLPVKLLAAVGGATLGAFLIALMRNIFDLRQLPNEQHGLILGGVILAAAGIEQWRVTREEGRGKREK